MRSAFPMLAAVVFAAAAIACGSSPMPAPTPLPPSTPATTPAPAPADPQPAPAPTPPQLNLTGTWDGTAQDSQGETKVRWFLTQNGDAVTGTVTTNSPTPDDGSCNSCHRNKSGTFSGTLTGTSLTARMFFAAGANGDPTPICSATMTGAAPQVAADRFDMTYTGSDSCEGLFAGGRVVLERKR